MNPLKIKNKKIETYKVMQKDQLKLQPEQEQH